jgi:hypothetical protein
MLLMRARRHSDCDKLSPTSFIILAAGTAVIAAANSFGARAVGIDINPERETIPEIAIRACALQLYLWIVPARGRL